MKFLNKIKENKAAIMSDVVVAMLIVILFTGIITTSFYKIYENNIYIRMNAIAVNYTIKVLEDIEKMTYEEVTDDLNTTLAQTYDIQDNYEVTVNVKKYNENDETKKDLIKYVTVNVKYKVVNETKNYTVKTLKIKEM